MIDVRKFNKPVNNFLIKNKFLVQNENIDYDMSGSNFIGKVGEKISSKVVINFMTIVNTEFGDCWLYHCVDENGNKIKFFNKKKFAEIGDTIFISGKVKQHSGFGPEFRETTLNYVKTI